MNLDFEKKQISGFNIISMTSVVDYLYDIVLDFKGMNILRVTNILDEDLSFKTTEENANIGNSLRIFLNNPLMKTKTIDIIVYYQTNDGQTAVSWVPKENTVGKQMDFMYTQCEPIHCRSLVPMQDTPSMKFTYDIEVETQRKYITFASANYTKETFSSGTRKTFFSNKIPTAGYLIALVSGDLVETKVGQRTYVITEPDMIDPAVAELNELD